MNAKNIAKSVKFFLKKNSPFIMVTAGAIGTVAAIVIACKQTTKLEKTKEKTTKLIEAVKEKKPSEEIAVAEPEKDTEYKKELVKTYAKVGAEYVKLYALPAAIEAVSIGMIFGGVGILNHRCVAVSAAASALEESFREYRNRVKNVYGEEVDRKIMTGEDIPGEVATEDGESEADKKMRSLKEGVTRESNLSLYARMFDEMNSPSRWTKNAWANKGTVLAIKHWANRELQKRGYLFLNEVYDQFGFERSKAGYAVGWVYDPDDPNHKGANCVDFGLEGPHASERANSFMNGTEACAWIDFNVDGVITDKVGAMLPKF